MDTILLIILILLLGATLGVLYLNLRTKPKEENENKEVEEIANLKSEIVSLKDTLNNTINNSLGSMSTSFNNLTFTTRSNSRGFIFEFKAKTQRRK